MITTEMGAEQILGSGMTRVEAVKRALLDGVTRPADIQNFCESLGVSDVKRSYISCIKWGVKQEQMAPVPNMDRGDVCRRDAIEFVLQCGGIESALRHLDSLSDEPGYMLVVSFDGVDSAKRAIKEIARKFTT